MHKVALQIGPLTIHWYGVFLATAFLVGLWTASRRALHQGIKAETILDAGVWLIVGSILGARLLYVISYWQESFAAKPFYEVFMIQKGGLVYYGGLAGATLAFILYARIQKLSLWKLSDILAPSVSLGYAIGRPGCLMNGCCYGHPTSLPWAIHYPADHETRGIGVHPSQLYDSLLAVGLYLGLAWVYRKKRFDGQVFALYLIGYACTRGFVEFFRGDYPVHYLGGWATPAHLVSLACLTAGLILYWRLPRPLSKST